MKCQEGARVLGRDVSSTVLQAEVSAVEKPFLKVQISSTAAQEVLLLSKAAGMRVQKWVAV